MNKSALLLSLAYTALLTSCAPTPPAATKATPELNPTPRNISPPEAVTEALLPDIQAAAENTEDTRQQPRLNIAVHEVQARDFFMGLVVDTKENMVVHPEVQGTISLELKNVTVPQVLDAVQKVYGYDYKKSEIGYIIYPATLQTKTFKIDRIDLLREGRSNTFISSGQSSNSNNNSQNNNAQNLQGYGATSPNNAANTQNTQQSSGSSIRSSTLTDFWKELESALQAIIAIDKNASVSINKQSGLIIARAKPMQLREIESFIADTQKQLGRQVILETKIMEVILNDSHQDGIDWKSVIRKGLQIAPTLGSTAGLVYTLSTPAASVSAGDFTALIHLLDSQGKTNVLSSPRISTLNNQQAIIKVGQDESFITGISPGLSSGSISGQAVQPAPILSAFFSGIALDVTPQISDADEITLHIHPSITRVESLERQYSIEGQQSSIPTARNTIRESDSIVKVKNGQVILLGGLMQETREEDKEGLTGLARIPYVGNLFRVNSGKLQKSELIILLQATVVNNDSQWQTPIDSSQQNYRQIDRTPRWQ